MVEGVILIFNGQRRVTKRYVIFDGVIFITVSLAKSLLYFDFLLRSVLMETLVMIKHLEYVNARLKILRTFVIVTVAIVNVIVL